MRTDSAERELVWSLAAGDSVLDPIGWRWRGTYPTRPPGPWHWCDHEPKLSGDGYDVEIERVYRVTNRPAPVENRGK